MDDHNDLNLTSILDDSIDIDNRNIFSKNITKQKSDTLLRPAESLDESISDSGFDTALMTDTVSISKTGRQESKPKTVRKRSLSDFEPDMDALLITAQSVMIKEGINLFMSKNYSASTLDTYTEAIKGIELYIKLLSRNPDNVNKIAEIKKRDADCNEVVSIAYNLYKKLYKKNPESIVQKIRAFKIVRLLFEDALNKSSINYSRSQLRFFYFLSGDLDEHKVKLCVENNDPGLQDLIKKLDSQIRVAIKMAKKNNYDGESGITSRDVNTYIIRASGLLKCYYTLTNNFHSSRYHARIYDIYTKFCIVVK